LFDATLFSVNRPKTRCILHHDVVLYLQVKF
jgi:hypothetical protein